MSTYQPVLIDATYAGLISGAADAPLVIPALNRDGDCLSDLVMPMFGSIAGAESVLLAFDDDYDTQVAMAEAPHGTAPALQGKDVANPMAMLLSCAAVLHYAGVRGFAGANTASRAIYESVLEATAAGVRTPDLGGHHGTTDFTSDVVERVGARSTCGRRWAPACERRPAAAAPGRPRRRRRHLGADAHLDPRALPALLRRRADGQRGVHIGHLDMALIDDGTYFVHEANGEIVACGGWSRRNRLFAGVGDAGDDDRLLDPATEPARVRAMFVRGDWTRRGLGRAILEACERAARAEGFTVLALMATLAGEPLYRAYGFRATERVTFTAPDGVTHEAVAMERPIDPA